MPLNRMEVRTRTVEDLLWKRVPGRGNGGVIRVIINTTTYVKKESSKETYLLETIFVQLILGLGHGFS